ncbi:hypothetical protein [Micromonospora sp. NPDC050200]|uniref:hypothetical protein n=1 Tax=Micromonospora sp. NPDC050200 TaxID=3155664 RepID=UPI0033ED652E
METLAQEQLAVLCARLDEEAGPLAAEGPMRTLATSIAERVRAGEDPAALAECLDELDDQLLRAGYAGGLGSHRSAPPQLPGLGGHPVLEVMTCPGGRCARVARPGRDDTCRVFGRPLEPVRLRP